MALPAQPTVLLISDDRNFAPELISAWQRCGPAPDFVCMTGEVPAGEGTSSFSLAIIGPVNAARAEAALERLARVARPVILVTRDPQVLTMARTSAAAPISIRRLGDWRSAVVRCAAACLGHAPEPSRFADDHSGQRELLLGRCLVETRHALNNALTSIIGNAELMLAGTQDLPQEIRENAATIYEMSLELHAMFRHMAALESEWQREHQAEDAGEELVALGKGGTDGHGFRG
ncbi:MAG: hypothetical protein JO041_16435 [Acidobacteria bacterium]|nr:hypothetical protein [Acidobacteriota bacterium]